MIDQYKNHVSSLFRFRNTSFVDPEHLKFGDYWQILLFLLKAVLSITNLIPGQVT